MSKPLTCEPFDSFVKALSSKSITGAYMPWLVFDMFKLKMFGALDGGKSVSSVHLISEEEDGDTFCTYV